jgi:hypothetical protein
VLKTDVTGRGNDGIQGRAAMAKEKLRILVPTIGQGNPNVGVQIKKQKVQEATKWL